jgi:photosystem II PsbJ protein
MFADGRIPLWIVATIAGLGVIGVVGIFFYGAYAGVGSGM